ncbi:MAG: DNA topoisomerase, partial [Cyanobacteria bacterium P01_F01_bin.42]
MSTLVIVESPTKAKTIRNFLPKDFRVEASMGHIRDLPRDASEIPAKVKGETWSSLGVNVDSDFQPLYVVPKDKKKVVSGLKSALAEADELLLATDEDREGESISWHLLQVLKPKVPTRRMVFHEITDDAITDALERCREVDQRLVRAQETRRILDRLVGYTLSPLLWKKIAPSLSAGRVQSVAVRLLVQKERERLAFVQGSYWDLKAKLAGVPLWHLIAEEAGRTARRDVFVYAAGGYYYPGKDVAALQAEIHSYRDRGYRVCKIKIGGAPGALNALDDDARRIDAALEVTGPGNLAVDANGRFDLETALRYAQMLKGYDLFWYEEPGDPLDYALQSELSAVYEGPMATGENLF